MMTATEWEESLPAFDRWILNTYAMSICFKRGAVAKKDRRKVKERLDVSLSRRGYCEDRAKGLYDQWSQLRTAEEWGSV